MNEKIPQNHIDSGDNNKNNSVYFTRHSRAKYKPYLDIIKGDNPEQAMDVGNQPEVDLTEEGIELAVSKAEEFFSRLDSGKNILFFVSSNERRALDTANIYKQIAKEKNFEVITPQNSREPLFEEVGGGDIRIIKNLSLDIKNVLINNVFSPETNLGDINWEAVSTETKNKWEKARKIVNAGDKGSWGANFVHYSKEIKELFPDEIKTAEDLYNTQFQNLIRLTRFGIRKAKESNTSKNVKILAFGHENYFATALKEGFKDSDLGNCESIHIQTGENDGDLIIDRRGESALL